MSVSFTLAGGDIEQLHISVYIFSAVTTKYYEGVHEILRKKLERFLAFL